MSPKTHRLFTLLLSTTFLLTFPFGLIAQRTQKPALHGKHWMAITGKPLGAHRRRNDFSEGRQRYRCCVCNDRRHVDDVGHALHGAAKPQALIFNPHTNKVIGQSTHLA